MNIETKVREDSGRPDWDLPLPDPDKQWIRFYCPYCQPLQRNRTGRKTNNPLTAAINYDAQWFECYRCKLGYGTRSASYPKSDTRLVEMIEEFKPQLIRQCRKVDGKFGKWVSFRELWEQSHELLWNYAYRPKGGKNDAGMFDDWEHDANGDTDKLKSYLGKALYGDLMNYAESEVNWKRKHGITYVPDDAEMSVIVAMPISDRPGGESYLESITDYRSDVRHSSSGALSSDGTASRGNRGKREASGRKDMTQVLHRGLAEADQVRFTSWGRSVLRCDATRNGLGPVKGHCLWCDRHLAVEDAWAHVNRNHVPSQVFDNPSNSPKSRYHAPGKLAYVTITRFNGFDELYADSC